MLKKVMIKPNIMLPGQVNGRVNYYFPKNYERLTLNFSDKHIMIKK